MAVINIYDSPFSVEPNTFEYFEKTSIEKMLSNYIDKFSDETELIECYDVDTGETIFVDTETEGYKTVVIANDKEVSLSYDIKENDVIKIMLIPEKKMGPGMAAVSEIVGGLLVTAGSIVGVATSWTGVGLVVGASLMAIGLGLQIYAAYSLSDQEKNSRQQESLESEKNLSISGCGNQDITDHVFPLILGKHHIAPYVVGSPYCTTYTKSFSGEDGGQYVSALYCVGYAPLRLTDFKIDKTYLAYNRSTESIAGIGTVMHGTLKGVSESNIDNGQILRKWKNNDVKIEILQAGDWSENDDDRYGQIFPQATEQLEVGANLINIKDSLIQELGNKIYKGASVPNGYMTNSVRFSRSCPKRIEVELDFPSGLYAQRSKKGKISYYNLPVRLAIQWRFVKKGQPSSDALAPQGWNNFDYIELSSAENGIISRIEPKLYTYEKKLYDYQSSRGQSNFYDYKGNSIPGGYYDKNKESDRKEFIENDKWLYAEKLFEFGTETQPNEIKTSENISIDDITNGYWTVTLNRFRKNGLKDSIESSFNCKISKETYEWLSKESYLTSMSKSRGFENNGKWVFKDMLTVNGSGISKVYQDYYRDDLTLGSRFTTDDFKKVTYDSNYIYCITKNFFYNKESLNHHNLSITSNGINVDDFKKKYGVNERRYVVVKEFTDEECRKLIGYDKDSNGKTYADIDSVEVRVIRITPSYLNEEGNKDTESWSNMTYQDLCKWVYMRTFSFDKVAFKKALDSSENKTSISAANYPLRPLSKEDMNKFCLVALTLKQDVAETGGSSLKQLSLIAESFCPKYDTETEKWNPENIREKRKYFERISTTDSQGIKKVELKYFDGDGLSEPQAYIDAKREGRDVGFSNNGNNFVDQIKNEIFSQEQKPQNYNEDFDFANPIRIKTNKDFEEVGWGAIGKQWTSTYIDNITKNSESYYFTPITKNGTIINKKDFTEQLEKFKNGETSTLTPIFKYNTNSYPIRDKFYAVEKIVFANIKSDDESFKNKVETLLYKTKLAKNDNALVVRLWVEFDNSFNNIPSDILLE
ncbi:MAG: hypothetical protein KBT03_08320, partial [Bacteroidales bacterium]|nr:hypothetical protein [Candidatus Scybalousia scybalohippi]